MWINHLWHVNLCLLFIASARAAVLYETVRRTHTHSPVYITKSVNLPLANLVQRTERLTSTIYVAKSSPDIVVKGTVATDIKTTLKNPVTQHSKYHTTPLTDKIVPSTYSTAITINPGPQVSAPSSVVHHSSKNPTRTLASHTTSTASKASHFNSYGSENGYDNVPDILVSIQGDLPAPIFPRQAVPLTIPDNVEKNRPIQTNKFYSNLFLGDQTETVFALPYQLWWSKNDDYFGWGVSQDPNTDKIYGPDPNANPVQFYTNPLKVGEVIFSASEIQNKDDMGLSVSNFDHLSVDVKLSKGGGSMTFPIVEGMGFVTAEYENLTPRLFSQVGIKTIVSHDTGTEVQKYILDMFSGGSWVMYVSNVRGDFNLTAASSNELVSSEGPCSAVIQIAVLPNKDEASVSALDSAAGMYPVGAHLSGSVSGTDASYSINYDTKGSSTGSTSFIWALPHHIESLSADCRTKLINDGGFSVYSPAKGKMAGCLTNVLTMHENVNKDLRYLPFSASGGTHEYSADQLQLIAEAANSEAAQDMVTQTDTSSTYTAGKIYDKFAYILLVVKDILKNDDLVSSTLDALQLAIDRVVGNRQQNPLMYDTVCGGITSSSAQNGGDPTDDFGNPFYNDHHFHYGYYLHAAAIIGYADNYYNCDWTDTYKDFFNTLVMDVANPVANSEFPAFRYFDWYQGHSWAHGMFVSGSGKDEESSSEDYNFAYGMKLWANLIGDSAMEARADIMLAIMKRTMDNYFYMKDTNTNQPANYLRNRVPGITFENGLHHTTYFGTNLEYIQGIHMIPLTPVSPIMRSSEFVQQEWTEMLAPIVDTLDTGWRGILHANQAIFDAPAAYNFFSRDDFQTEWLDDGASRTWYLAWSAGRM